MAATRGPIPQRTDETVRRNVGEPVDKVPAFGPVEVPELGLGVTHFLVADLYEAMKNSAQAKYFEPTDWQYARLTLHQVNQTLLTTENIPAMKLAALNQMLASLLLTEGDRRRVRIEVERKNPEGGQVLNFADAMKSRVQSTQGQVPGGGCS